MLTMTIISLSHKHSATYDVQDAELHGGRANISIQCVFAFGSQARGCHVEISNSSVQININRNGDSQSHTPEQTVTVPAPERLYEVFIFDWERDGSVASSPSYVGHVNVSAPEVLSSVPPTTGKLLLDYNLVPLLQI